jgi:hypothetical protein
MKINKADLRNKLCLTFCKYYRPSKKEDLSCIGFRIIERLILKGRDIPFGAGAVALNRLTREALVREMCAFCPFYADDCDFVKKKENSTACGGFILVGQLIEAKVIVIDNIRDVR